MISGEKISNQTWRCAPVAIFSLAALNWGGSSTAGMNPIQNRTRHAVSCGSRLKSIPSLWAIHLEPYRLPCHGVGHE